MMDRLEALAFFIRIVEKRGVAAAGRDFGMSPATASDRLAALEAHYGTTLLHRTTRSISLTNAGELLLGRARTLVADAEDLEAHVRFGVDQLSGKIRISSPHDLGERRIVPLIDEFMQQYPLVTVEVLLTDGYVDIVGQGIDLAIRFGVLKDSALIARKIGANKRVICASPDYLEMHGFPERPEALAEHNCLIMQFGSHFDQEWPFVIDGKRCDIMVAGNRSANSGAQVRRWCLDGRGVALKSTWDVQLDLDSGRLVELLTDYAPPVSSALQIVYHRGSASVRRIRALMDYFMSDLRKQ